MDSQLSPTPFPKRKRRLWILLISVAALTAVCGLVIFGLFKHQQEQDRLDSAEIEKRLAALRAAGEPLTVEELGRIYPDPDPEHDSSILLSPAVSRLSVREDLDHVPWLTAYKLPHGANPLEEPMRLAIQTLVDTNRAALAALKDVDLTEARLSASLSKGLVGSKIPRVGPLIQLSKLSCLDSVLSSESRDIPGAIRSILLALQVSRSCRSGVPILQVQSRAGEFIAGEAVERLLNRSIPSTADLEILDRVFADEDLNGFQRELQHSQTLGLYAMESWRSMAKLVRINAKTPIARLLAEYKASLLFVDRDMLVFLDWHEHLASIFKLSSRQQFESITTNRLVFPKNLRKSTMANLSVASDFSRLIRTEYIGVAFLRATRTALAVERWRLAHDGRLPDSLAELVPSFVPAVPVDPFDDQPLRYRKLPKGYVIYSVGPDFSDDGGREKSDNAKDTDHYDISFTVER